jgi:hypothetical protein
MTGLELIFTSKWREGEDADLRPAERFRTRRYGDGRSERGAPFWKRD